MSSFGPGLVQVKVWSWSILGVRVSDSDSLIQTFRLRPGPGAKVEFTVPPSATTHPVNFSGGEKNLHWGTRSPGQPLGYPYVINMSLIFNDIFINVS